MVRRAGITPSENIQLEKTMTKLPKASKQQIDDIIDMREKILHAFVCLSCCQRMQVSHLRDMAQDAAEIAVGAELR